MHNTTTRHLLIHLPPAVVFSTAARQELRTFPYCTGLIYSTYVQSAGPALSHSLFRQDVEVVWLHNAEDGLNTFPVLDIASSLSLLGRVLTQDKQTPITCLFYSTLASPAHQPNATSLTQLPLGAETNPSMFCNSYSVLFPLPPGKCTCSEGPGED